SCVLEMEHRHWRGGCPTGGEVVREPSIPNSCVGAATCVVNERAGTGGRVAAAVDIERKRTRTYRRVAGAGCIVFESSITDGSVVGAVVVVHERVPTQERVIEENIAALLTNRSCLRRKRQAGERE